MESESFGRAVVRWYRASPKSYPWRQRWQQSKDPYAVWVSEVMLQQTTIAAVLNVYDTFLARFSSVSALAAAPLDQVLHAVQGLGYYRRFRLLHKGAKAIVDLGYWPRSSSEWRTIPGVGDYTAAAIASLCFGEVVGVVDGNVKRVIARYFGLDVPIDTPKGHKVVRTALEPLVCREDPGGFNEGIMEIGQTLCTRSRPNCPECPLSSGCVSQKMGYTDSIPVVTVKEKPIEVDMIMFMLQKSGRQSGRRFGLWKRGNEAPFLKGTSGLPFVLVEPNHPTKGGPSNGDASQELGTFQHSITNHKIRVRVVSSTSRELKRLRFDDPVQWVDETEFLKLIVSSLDRKAWNFRPQP